MKEKKDGTAFVQRLSLAKNPWERAPENKATLVPGKAYGTSFRGGALKLQAVEKPLRESASVHTAAFVRRESAAA